MSNPTFGVGAISFPVVSEVSRFRLVALGVDGIEHAGAGDVVYGAVTEPGTSDENDPRRVLAVHRYGVVPVEVSGAVAGFERGAVVSAAADGKVKLAAAGETPVGVVVGSKGGSIPSVLVDLRLSLPGEPAAGGAG